MGEKWRLVELEANNAALNMAIDEAVLGEVANGFSPPTIRFYKWQPSAVSIGYFQSMLDEVDTGLAQKTSVDVVRRSTGGGAVYHDSAGEITYSVIASEKLFPIGITQSYHVICGWIVSALAGLGISAGFKPVNDVIAYGKKISGNAQTRRRGVLLQHGTVLCKLDVATMFSLLKVPREKISDKFIESVKERVTSIHDIDKSITTQQIYNAMKAAFTRGKDFESGSLNEGETMLAEKLAREKYSSREWNYLR